MRKTFVALSALVVGGGLASGAFAQVAPTVPTTSVDYSNAIQAAVDAQSTNFIHINIAGTIKVKGLVEPDSVGQALVDGKQLLNNSLVTFITPPDGTDLLGNVFANFANVDNTATIGEAAGAFSGAAGNIGVSVAAGDTIAQDNAVAIATVRSRNQAIKADVVKLQEALQGVVNSTQEDAVIITNAATIVDGSFTNASGSVGANVAAGYNIGQENSLAVAAAVGGPGTTVDIDLASANVGVIQHIADNVTYVARNTNTADVGGIGAGFAGNAGINAAAGGNLLQNNALAVTSN